MRRIGYAQILPGDILFVSWGCTLADFSKESADVSAAPDADDFYRADEGGITFWRVPKEMF